MTLFVEILICYATNTTLMAPNLKCNLCKRTDCAKMASEKCIEIWFDNFMQNPTHRIIMDRLAQI